MNNALPVRIFLSFASEDTRLFGLLRRHLAPLLESGQIVVWSRLDVRGGDDIEQSVAVRREAADVVVPLISADYLGSEHRSDLEWAAQHKCRLVPILLRPCAHREDPLLRRCKVLPHDDAGVARPVARTLQSLHDEALTLVIEQLKECLSLSGGPLDAEPRAAESAEVAQRASLAEIGYVVIPPAPARQSVRRRAAASWLLAPVSVILLATVVLILMGSREAPTSTSSPTSTAAVPASASPTASASARAEAHPCCGGVDCQPPDWDVRNTYCEQYPGQCRDCSLAGRRYIPGSCNDHLPPERPFLLRLAYGNHRDFAIDEVCVRLAGAQAWTCTPSPVNVPASARSSRLSVRVADLLHSGRGIDIELRSWGVTVASRTAAKHGALSTSMLCAGVAFSVGVGKAVFYLDDP